MSRASATVKSLPPQVERALRRLGGDLRIARERRGEALRPWAARMGTSVPTLQRMEAGDPTVGVSVYATALWLAGKANELSALADPAADDKALSMEIASASRRRKP